MTYDFEVIYYDYDTGTHNSEYPTEYADTYLNALKKVIKKYDRLHGVDILRINTISVADTQGVLWGYEG